MTNTKSHDQQGTRHKTHTVLTIIKIEACVYYFYVTHTHTQKKLPSQSSHSHPSPITPYLPKGPMACAQITCTVDPGQPMFNYRLSNEHLELDTMIVLPHSTLCISCFIHLSVWELRILL